MKFKERYKHELPKWLRLLGAWRINTESIDFVWGYFAPRPGLELILHRGTYFNQRYAISFALGWGKFMVYLPFKTKLTEGCDMPQYGFQVHSDTAWLHIGGPYDESIGQVQGKSWYTWDLPFFSHVFDGHWVQNKSRVWIKMRQRNEPGWDSWEFRESQAYVESHHYTYRLKNGTVQNRIAKCTIEKRKWHRKWFPFLSKESQVIDIEFDDEVGERSGSWKGGTIGCSYDMRPDDTIETCLRRMEKERKM